MTPSVFLATAIRPAFGLLPRQMDSAKARAHVLAIALQESDLTERRQKFGGPARGYVQFERSGISGVLQHTASSLTAMAMCRALDIPASVAGVYTAIEYQDVLSAVFARLLLWTSPLRLGGPDEPDVAWDLYLDVWRPGAPRRERWNGCYTEAWHTVLGDDRRPPVEERA